MNRKKIVAISSVGLFIFLVMFLMIQKGTFSVEEYKYVFNNTKEVNLYKHELHELIRKTSNAFYYNKEFIKYKSGDMPGLDGINYSYQDFTVSPEDLNKDNMVYMNDASFIYSVYLNALGMDLSEGLVEDFNLETGYGFDIDTILKIIKFRDKRLVLESDETSYSDQGAFVSKVLKTLDIGDIIVYSKNRENKLALYLGIDQDNKHKCIYFDEKGNGSGIYMHDVNNLLFPNNSFLASDTYYAIIRPINVLEYNPQDRTILNVPVNSLARMEDIYIRRYTDVGVDNVYRGEIINFTIEVTNDSNEEKSIDRIVDVVNNYLEFVNVKDGLYDNERKEVLWNNVKLSANETRKFTYTVKVKGDTEIGSVNNEDSVYGKEILAGDAKILYRSDSEVFNVNSIKYMIANRYISEQENDLNNVVEQLDAVESYLNYGVSDDGYKTNILEITNDDDTLIDSISFNSFIYYNAFGVDLGILGFDSFDNIRNVLFTKDETGIYTRNAINLEDIKSVNINKMVVSNLYGGTALNDNNKSKIFSSITSENYTYNNLVSGDIIVYWDYEGNPYSYFVMKEMVDDKETTKIYNFSRESGIISKSLDSWINRIINESSLYVVLRPSMILDIELKDVQIDPINLNLDDEKRIVFVKKPVNATINSISYSESNLFIVDNETHMINGVRTGTDMLTVTFNETVKKDVSVSIVLAILGNIFETDYQYDKENMVFYVGNDRDVKTILERINFVSDGYMTRIVDSNYNEILDTISDVASLEVKYNGDWIGNYRIVYFSLKSDSGIQVLNDEKIIKNVIVDTKVKDLNNILYINDDKINVEFYNKDNEKLNDDDVLSTGDFLTFKITDKLQEQYQISVVGDVSGNGIFNGNDVVLTRRHIVGWKNPETGIIYEASGVYEYAMDFSMNGNVNGNDLSEMRRKLVE